MINKIKESNLEESLNKILDVRLNRKKIYGDSWKNNEDRELLAFIYQKYERLKKFIINKDIKNNYENEIDTLIDLINYSLFLLQNKIDAQKK